MRIKPSLNTFGIRPARDHWESIFQAVFLEAIIFAVYWGVAKVIGIATEIRDWGYVAVFVASIFAVIWYLKRGEVRHVPVSTSESIPEKHEDAQLAKQISEEKSKQLRNQCLRANDLQRQLNEANVRHEEQLPYANWMHASLSKDREALSAVLASEVKIEMGTIFEKRSDIPHIWLQFNIRSSSNYRVVIGENVEGDTTSSRVGGLGMPRKQINPLVLDRGQAGLYSVRHDVTEGQRDHFIAALDGMPEVIQHFNLKYLRISVGLYSKINNELVHEQWLPLDKSQTGVLHRSNDWPSEQSSPQSTQQTSTEEHQ